LKQCADRIRAVRKRIDQLPEEERTWQLLWLSRLQDCDDFVTDRELIDMCKKLGPKKMLLMLQDRMPSDDPDLQPRMSNNSTYQPILFTRPV